MPDQVIKTSDVAPNTGVVSSVRGTVVDVRFDGDLPVIHTLLRAGADGHIAIEVLAQRDARHVRGIALTPTQGLARGMPVHDTGGPLQAPVGKAILSHMFDVFGNTIDRGAALEDVAWRSVHGKPPPLARRSTQLRGLRDRHQGHRCADPAGARRQGRPCSAARVSARRCCSPR